MARSVPLGIGWSKGLAGNCDIYLESVVSNPKRGFYGIDTVSIRCESLARYMSGDRRLLSETVGSKGDLVAKLRENFSRIDAEAAVFLEKRRREE